MAIINIFHLITNTDSVLQSGSKLSLQSGLQLPIHSNSFHSSSEPICIRRVLPVPQSPTQSPQTQPNLIWKALIKDHRDLFDDFSSSQSPDCAQQWKLTKLIAFQSSLNEPAQKTASHPPFQYSRFKLGKNNHFYILYSNFSSELVGLNYADFSSLLQIYPRKLSHWNVKWGKEKGLLPCGLQFSKNLRFFSSF